MGANSLATVCDKITWNNTQLYRSEVLAAYSYLTMLFGTMWEDKVLQSVSTSLSEAVVVIMLHTAV